MDAILDATEQLAGASGIEAVRMRDVARRAGVSQGTLYQYFSTAAALVAAWEARAMDRFAGAAEEMVAQMLSAPPPLETCVRALVGLAIDSMERLFAFYRQPTQTDFVSRLVERSRLAERVVGTVEAGLLAHPDSSRALRAANVTMAARVTVKMALYLGFDRMTSSLDEGDRTAYRLAVADAAVHYLLRDDPARRGGPEAPFG